MNEQAQRGRWILLCFSLLVVAISGFVIVLYLSSVSSQLSSPAGRAAVATRSIRFLLTILLLLGVFRGSDIARWIAIVLFGLAALMGLPFLDNLLMAGMVATYAAFVGCLLMSGDVHAFLEYQRSRR